MSAVSPVVEARLRVIQKQILATPEYYNQNSFGHVGPCGSICCIGGWLHYNAVGAKKHNQMVKNGQVTTISDEAVKLVGYEKEIKESPWFLPNLLNYANYWPDDYYLAYSDAVTPLEKAQVAVKRIDHFIETGE